MKDVKLEDLAPEIIAGIDKFRKLPDDMKKYQYLQYEKTTHASGFMGFSHVYLLASMLLLTGAEKEQIELGLQFAQQHGFWRK